jgi:peptide/nickel transport system permease protein
MTKAHAPINASTDTVSMPVHSAQQRLTGGRGRSVWYRILRTRNGVIGLVIMVIVLLVALFGPLIAPYDPIAQNLPDQLQPPSVSHWFGTDEFGRDILSRMLYGTRIALEVGLIADGISLVVGVSLGLIAGYVGGRTDSLIMRVMDVLLAFPYLLLAMMIVAILGPSLQNAMIAIGIVYVPQYTRLIRGSVLSLRSAEFVYAARIIGASQWRLLTKHILLNCYSPILVQATLSIGSAIVETAGLGFLGLGAQPPLPDWGAMLSTGRNFILQAPWISTFPGLAILVTVIGFNLFGDGLRDALDPKSNRSP